MKMKKIYKRIEKIEKHINAMDKISERKGRDKDYIAMYDALIVLLKDGNKLLSLIKTDNNKEKVRILKKIEKQIGKNKEEES